MTDRAVCTKIKAMKYDVAIIGGGASGLACAVRLCESGKNLKLAVIDAGERLGKKLAATGNGQGNISNADMSAAHYFGGNVALAGRIACADPYSGSTLFDCLFCTDEKGRIYPAGKQASALTDCLIRKLRGRADIYLSARVADVSEGFIITLADGRTLSADFAVICTGGKAQKQFKTDGSSYALAEKFGHKITALYPSLVQLRTETRYIKTLKGIRADCAATAFSKDKPLKRVRGDVIFTDYGVSGNAVFSLSPYVTDKERASISLEFLPDIAADEILSNLKRREKSGMSRDELLSGTLHNRLGRAVIARAGAGADEETIVRTLKNFTLPVVGTLGFDYAQVTRGGVEMSGVTDELESRLCKNLFFAGEILDIDGDCGGYNLQWAFTGGMAVADAILKRL